MNASPEVKEDNRYEGYTQTPHPGYTKMVIYLLQFEMHAYDCRLPQRVTVIHTRDRGDKAYGIHRLAILQVTEQVCHTLKVNSLTFEAVYHVNFSAVSF